MVAKKAFRGLSDDIVEAASLGSQTAVEAVISWAAPRVRARLRQTWRPSPSQREDAEDLEQEALHSLYRALPRLRNRTVRGVAALAARIAERKGFRRIRAAKGSRIRVVAGALRRDGSRISRLWEKIEARTASPSSAAGRAERIHKILASMSCLDPIDREIIRLAVFEQKLLREIWETLRNVPSAPPSAEAVRKRLVRALGRLQQLVLESLPHERNAAAFR